MREIDIAQPCRFEWWKPPFGLAPLHRCDELPETFGCKGGQQPTGIAKVMRRRGMANARPFGHGPQGKALDPALRQLRFGRRQQRGAQIAMMIAVFFFVF